MILFDRDTEKEIAVIAEIGMNHEGSLDWIFDIMPKLKAADVDAVKFQLYTPDFFVSRQNKERYRRVSSYSLSKSQFELICDFGQSINLPVFATPVSHDWVEYIASRCGVVKIASGDFTFEPTIKRSLLSNAKVIVSTGASTRDEVVDFMKVARQLRSDQYLSDQVALLHCVSSYPPKLEEANLNAIEDLRKVSGITVGFSSHFLEDAPIYGAVSLGARIVEIHVTLNRHQSEFRDHSLSRTPSEMKVLVSSIRKLNQALGSKVKEVQPSEKEIVSEIRKGFIYARHLKSGITIVEGDIAYSRPASNFFRSSNEIIGRTLTKDIEALEAIMPEHFR